MVKNFQQDRPSFSSFNYSYCLMEVNLLEEKFKRGLKV